MYRFRSPTEYEPDIEIGEELAALRKENEELKCKLFALNEKWIALQNDYMVENLTLECLTKIKTQNQQHATGGTGQTDCQESFAIFSKLLMDFLNTLKDKKKQIVALKAKLQDVEERAKDKISALELELKEAYTILENTKLKAVSDEKGQISEQQLKENIITNSREVHQSCSKPSNLEEKQILCSELCTNSLAESPNNCRSKSKNSLDIVAQTNGTINNDLCRVANTIPKTGASTLNNYHSSKYRSKVGGKSAKTEDLCHNPEVPSSVKHDHTPVHKTWRIWTSSSSKSNRPVTPIASSDKNPSVILNELCDKKSWSPPEFTLVKEFGPQHQKKFIYKVKVNGLEYNSSAASSKKQAKAKAAEACLDLLLNKAGT